MELLLSFIAGLAIAAVAALFIIRNIKASDLKAQDKALEEAAKHTEQLLTSKDDAHKAAIDAMEKHHSDVISAMEKRHNDAIEAEKKRFDASIVTLKEQLQNATNQMLKERQSELQQSNSANMKLIVDPLKETIKKMEEAIKENKSTQETSTEAIKEKIETLVNTTMRVSSSADRLSNALTQENKTQGNWGEQKIEALLSAIGLEKGLEYDAQEYLRDAGGNIIISNETSHRMQPDIILHLDETRDLIIDSKVSLNAYVDYTNADSDEARSLALALHIKSIRNHVKELARKNYSAYIKAPRQSVDFVMMFVPVDGALQLALASDTTLWREAMNQGVFIVGEQNLYAALRAVQVTWTAIKQNMNNKTIFDTAEELISRVGDMLERLQKVGKKLDEAQSAYESVMDKAQKGQSVLGSARKLVKLGAKTNNVHPLPQYEEDEN